MSEVILQSTSNYAKEKKKKLILSLLLDSVGYISYLIPFLGEFSDLFWAPIAGFVLKSMYKGTIGTVGGIIAFVEEALPGIDFIPTFTLTWLYTYVYKKDRVDRKSVV